MVAIVCMLRVLGFQLAIIIVLTLFLVTPIFAAARLEPLTVGYSNVTATYAPLWIAVEENIGTKYGLDLKAIYAGRCGRSNSWQPVTCRSLSPRARLYKK